MPAAPVNEVLRPNVEIKMPNFDDTPEKIKL